MRHTIVLPIVSMLLACSHSHAPAQRAGESTETIIEKNREENVTAISEIEELIEVLTRDNLTRDAAQAALQQSNHSSVRSARLVTAGDDHAVEYVELALTNGITLAELVQHMGPYHRAPVMPDGAQEYLLFTDRYPERQLTCTLIVTTTGADDESLDQGMVYSVILRRDIRL